ncbi:MAG: transketolase [Candidatus Pelagibacter sp. TMED273]|nr:MAG: transketolase [Candidatus Pelagibacter sp. TMED273]|tara:strand:- start:1782 stop:2750 length:969 start_codon:yes stop_codon:yes gene_type:complete
MIDKKKIKMWSLMGARATVGLYALEIVKKNPNLIVLSSDVSTSAGLDRFRKQFPQNYIEIGIAEQNLIGVAAGLASENFDVVTTTFAPFQTLRCCEQIKVNLSYMNQKVIMIGIASGLVQGPLGYTHCCLEDLSIMRSLPNLSILSPADSLETVKSVDAALKNKQPTYIRITGTTNNPIVYEDDYSFVFGEAITLKKGKDIVLMATGTMVNEALVAAEKLKEIDIKVGVVNFHTIKPIDKKKILELGRDNKLIFTIEEHNLIGGFSSAVSEILSTEQLKCRQIPLGVNDIYDKGGSYIFLKDKHGLTAEKIFIKVKDEYEKI